MNIEEINAKIKELNDQRMKLIRDEFQKGLKGFFDKWPQVKALAWTQYTPYFNDGEECIFSVGDVYALAVDPRDIKESFYTIVEGEDESRTFNIHKGYDEVPTGNMITRRNWMKGCDETFPEVKYVERTTFKDPRMTDKFAKAIKDIGKFVHNCSDVAYEAYGDHVRVFVGPDWSDVEEYAHD